MKSKENKIKQLLQEQNIDGAIISSPENFHYIAGFAGHQHTVSRQPGFSFAVMSCNDNVPTHAATMDFEEETFRLKNANNLIIKKYDTWVGLRKKEEIENFTDAPPAAIFESSFDVLIKTVKELDLYNKKIGLEMDYLPINYYRQLAESFPKAEFVNISDLFVYARSVKTAEEIEMFRKLCAVADEGFYKVSQLAAPGVSEKELAACFRQSVIASNFCVPSSWSMFSTGVNAARLTLPENNIIKEGDVVKFDAGVNAEFDFYTTDTSRSWIIGKGDPVVTALKDRLYEAQRKMIAAAKPGLPICELFQTGYNWVHEKYPSYRRGHLGHSISLGPATAEAPYINQSEKRPLEAGMVLAMEVPCYMPNYAGFNIEDMVLITENGAEILTPKTPHYI
ncbi:Xaa-Pro peptidase family protein [Tyzzerella sp. OttesenSCG-928-J15]|nr:Xaa-Pro peptidase family protein [Tyzzerella sp. OttesenSCG-928-J15]